MKWTLRLTFENQWGDSYTMAIDVDQHVSREIQHIEPPPRDEIEKLVRPMTFDQVCEVIKRRQFRKDLFIGETKRLGALLAERMEDAEGWHDESRIEPAMKELRGKRA